MITRLYPPTARARARQLRQRGLTDTEICEKLGTVPKRTLAYWFNDIHLNGKQQARIRAKIVSSAARGRPLALKAWAKKTQHWREQIEVRVKPFGTLAYSDTRSPSFGDTDPTMIKTFLRLLRQQYDVDEKRLRVRLMRRWDQDHEALERYWSRVTGIPRRQFYLTYADKRTRGQPTCKRHYRGVRCLQYGDATIQHELQAIGEAVLRVSDGGAGGD